MDWGQSLFEFVSKFLQTLQSYFARIQIKYFIYFQNFFFRLKEHNHDLTCMLSYQLMAECWQSCKFEFNLLARFTRQNSVWKESRIVHTDTVVRPSMHDFISWVGSRSTNQEDEDNSNEVIILQQCFAFYLGIKTSGWVLFNLLSMLDSFSNIFAMYYILYRPVVPGCAGCAMAHPDFGRSI